MYRVPVTCSETLGGKTNWLKLFVVGLTSVDSSLMYSRVKATTVYLKTNTLFISAAICSTLRKSIARYVQTILIILFFIYRMHLNIACMFVTKSNNSKIKQQVIWSQRVQGLTLHYTFRLLVEGRTQATAVQPTGFPAPSLLTASLA